MAHHKLASTRHLVIPALLASALLAACGSGGSHSSSATTTAHAAPATTAPSATTAASGTTASPGTTAPPVTTAPPATTTPPATTATPPTTVKAVATGSSCPDGSWTSTNYTQAVQGQHIAGGAGIRFTITPSAMSVDFTGMQPVTITGNISGQGIFLGQEQAPSSFSPAGTFALPVKGTSNVTFEAKFSSQASYSPPIKAGGFPTGGISGTYTCSGSTMSMTVQTPQGPTTVTLARS